MLFIFKKLNTLKLNIVQFIIIYIHYLYHYIHISFYISILYNYIMRIYIPSAFFKLTLKRGQPKVNSPVTNVTILRRDISWSVSWITAIQQTRHNIVSLQTDSCIYGVTFERFGTMAPLCEIGSVVQHSFLARKRRRWMTWVDNAPVNSSC